MKRTHRISLGIIAVLVGMGFVMPALAQWRHEVAMTSSSVALCLLGALMTLVRAAAAFQGMAKHSA